MTAFPQSIHFIGTNTPRRVEMSVRNLTVEGTIPAEIEGAFFRAVPDNAHAPMFPDDIALNADGMIARFNIENGAVDFDIKYVETERFLAEKGARRALFGQYRNPFTDDPSVEGVDRTVANTTPVWHGGRLFMTKEDGRGYEVNPHSLETVGKWDYNGKLKSQTFTAHPRIDPKTGELFFFGYEAGGLCTLDVAYCIADADGNLIKEQWFDQPYASTIHDFVITENYAIWPIFPTLADMDRLKAGGAHWAHRQDLPSYIGIMPRYGRVGNAVDQGPGRRILLPRSQRLRSRWAGAHRPVPDRYQRLCLHARSRRHSPPAAGNPGCTDPLDHRHGQGRSANRAAPTGPSGRPVPGGRCRPGPAV